MLVKRIMTTCNKGKEMLLDLQRSDWLPAYDEDGLRLVLVEIEDMKKVLEGINEEFQDYGDASNYPDSAKTAIFYFTSCLKRNMRYIQSYLNHRMIKIRQLRWEVGPVLPSKVRDITISTRENDYFTSYNEIVSEYFDNIGFILTSDLEPPKDLMIEVRVLKNCQEIMTENGPVRLDAGTTQFLRRSDVEDLIRQGVLEHISSDEF